jgi:hypothetical protein
MGKAGLLAFIQAGPKKAKNSLSQCIALPVRAFGKNIYFCSCRKGMSK